MEKQNVESCAVPAAICSAFSWVACATLPSPGVYVVVVSSDHGSAVIRFGMFCSIVSCASTSRGNVNRCVSSKC